MKKIIGAFLWDNTTKTISYMVVNHRYKILSQPRKYTFEKNNLKQFKKEAKNIIRHFFEDMVYWHKRSPYYQIEIEYKIVHRVTGPMANYYQPTNESAWVRKTFLHHYALTKGLMPHMKLGAQLKYTLKRPELDKFKKTLRAIELVQPSRHNHYQYHLWTLATHATKKNYQVILQRLSKQVTYQFSGSENL